jgi:methylmalonyl-CoA mutase
VNTFLSSKGSPTVIPAEVIRATEEEKQYQIEMLDNLHKTNENKVAEQLHIIQEAAINNQNIFEKLMEAPRCVRWDKLQMPCLKWADSIEGICKQRS